MHVNRSVGTLKKKREPAFIHPGHFILFPILIPCDLISLRARSVAFCGPAVGIKAATSQRVRIRESLGQGCRTEGLLLGAGYVLGSQGRGAEASVSKEAAHRKDSTDPVPAPQPETGKEVQIGPVNQGRGAPRAPCLCILPHYARFFSLKMGCLCLPMVSLPPCNCGFCVAFTLSWCPYQP